MTSISKDDLLGILADELDAARIQLETLGVSLIADAAVATRHMTALQALDHVGQRCALIASILRADDPHAACHAASLESITTRLALLSRRSRCGGTPGSAVPG